MPSTIQYIAGAFLASAGVAHAANLTAGIYGVSSYFVSATATGGGSCAFPAGTYLSSDYTYPGPGKTGAIVRTFINGNGVEYVRLMSGYPATPANGATTWSGNVTATFLPGGSPVTGTFSTTYTVTDSQSYVARTTYVTPSGAGSCTAVVQEVGVWTAK